MKLSDLKFKLPSGKIAQVDRYNTATFHCEDGTVDFVNLGEVEVVEEGGEEAPRSDAIEQLSFELMDINKDYIENLKEQVRKNEQSES